MLSTTALPVLYSFRRCPYAMRARMAIVASGQCCELREVVLRDKPADLLATSPKGTVPVLVEPNGHVIDQSLDIMLWALQQNDPAGWLQPALDDMLQLVAACDGDFKNHLDRYKYPQRHAEADATSHRQEAGTFITQLETRLAASPYLFAHHATLADFAIAPFVRQFANVEPDWFASQPWPHVQAWLAALVNGPVWTRVMDKYPQWVAGTDGIAFPPA